MTAEQDAFRQLTANTRGKLSKLSSTISYSNPDDILSPIQARRYRGNELFYHSPVAHVDIAGQTWDCQHLDSFLVRSRFSTNRFGQTHRTLCNSYSKRSPQDTTEYYFRTTEQNKNASYIGFGGDNPLVSDHAVLPGGVNKISERLQARTIELPEDKNRYRYAAQSLKFKRTDPVTFIDVGANEGRHPSYKKTRLKFLIDKRYPKGMVGVDNPELPQSVFYSKQKHQSRIREQPNSHEDYVMDAQWKSKKHCGPFKHQPKLKQTLRKFSNTSSAHYNILNNRS